MVHGAEVFSNAEVRNEGDAVVHAFTAFEENVAARRARLGANFPIGADSDAREVPSCSAGARSENQVNPQTEILLQLAVDGLADALDRTRSPIGPQAR